MRGFQKVADEIDRANDTADLYLQHALHRCLKTREVNIYTGFECIECGDEIGEKRKRALPKASRCIDCQIALEAQQRLYIK